VLTSFSAADVAEFVQRASSGELAGYRPPGIALQVPPSFRDIPIITAASVAAAHRLGVEVHAWTINDEAEIEALLALGVDGIMTDFPAVAAPVLARRRG
jgi:glycerophosphoryl diester phosphodiesterase